MPPDRIRDDIQHDPAAVGIERVTCGEIDRLGIVQRPPGGDNLVQIIGIERQQVGDLFAARIDYGQLLALRKAKGGARPFGNGDGYFVSPGVAPE